MTKITCTNGVVLSYDESIQPGDLITAYAKGYFEFVRFEDRGKRNTPLAHFKKRYREDGSPIKSQKLERCDASYCQKAKGVIEQRIVTMQQSIAALQNIINTQCPNELPLSHDLDK